MTDPVEIAALLAAPRTFDEMVIDTPFPVEVAEFLGGLSEPELQRIAGLATSFVPDRPEEAQDIGRWLAAFTAVDLSGLQQAFVDADVYYPGIVFRGAPPVIRDRIAQTVETDPDSRNHALLALAWIGDNSVVELFARWRANPPKWRSALYIAPEEYARGAAWELDETNRRRDLYLHAAFALTESSDEDASPAVRVVFPATGECLWCTGPLTKLLKFDLADQRLEELDLPQEVVTCAQCSCYGTIFMSVDGDGISSWHSLNEKPAYFLDEAGSAWTSTRRLGLGQRRNRFHVAEAFLPTSCSQVGGAPGWIQDFEFPRCPECHRTMTFIAQVSPEDVEELAEGRYYAFWCGDCRITAASYQQT